MADRIFRCSFGFLIIASLVSLGMSVVIGALPSDLAGWFHAISFIVVILVFVFYWPWGKKVK